MRRIVTLVAAAAMVGAGLNVPAGAQEPAAPAPAIPETVVIADPFQDANGLNDQGNSGNTGFQGDNVTPADAGNASDIGKVWFTDDATTVTAHVQVQLPPPGSQALRFDVYTAPGEGSAAASTLGCARFGVIFEGVAQGQQTTWRGPDQAKFFDACNEGSNWFNNGVEAVLTVTTLEDGTAIISIAAPKDASPFLATGLTLSGTTAISRVAAGGPGLAGAYPVTIDNTKVGIDYLITGGEVEPEETPPPGCVKGKGKKKGCKKKP